MKKQTKQEKHGKKSLPANYSTKYDITELNMSQREISEEIGISQQAIQQIETKALIKFKKRFCKMFPDTYPIIQTEIGRGVFGR